MRILLYGRHGQLGRALASGLRGLGEVIALGRETTNGLSGDLTDGAALEAGIERVRPDIVVNAAAMTAVDRAEHARQEAWRINADAPGCMARAAARCGAVLVHYSTDYVFSGAGSTPWREEDTPAPLNVYGASKLAGEQAIQASGCRHLIFRTSWVFSAEGRNFLTRILELARSRDTLEVVDDQIGAPTSTRLITDVTVQALGAVKVAGDGDSPLGGLYHLAAAGETSWWDYARFIVATARECGAPLRLTPERIVPVATTPRPGIAARPANSRLDSARLRTRLGLSLPAWQDDVRVEIERLVGQRIQQ